VDKTVARLNIEHYRKLLANEVDEVRRQQIARLLAEEEAKLARFENTDKRRKALEFLYPFAPMRRLHINSLSGFRLHPSVQDSTARKHERVRPVVIEVGNFDIAVEWCRGNRPPLTVATRRRSCHSKMSRPIAGARHAAKKQVPVF
jgi:hypothetical protein